MGSLKFGSSRCLRDVTPKDLPIEREVQRRNDQEENAVVDADRVPAFLAEPDEGPVGPVGVTAPGGQKEGHAARAHHDERASQQQGGEPLDRESLFRGRVFHGKYSVW